MSICLCGNDYVCSCRLNETTDAERWKSYAGTIETERNEFKVRAETAERKLKAIGDIKFVEPGLIRAGDIQKVLEGDLTSDRDEWRVLVESVKEELKKLHEEPYYDRGTLLMFLDRIELIFEGDD
jgi:hypothetical protein